MSIIKIPAHCRYFFVKKVLVFILLADMIFEGNTDLNSFNQKAAKIVRLLLIR